MSTRATEDALAGLHDALAKEFINRIRSGGASPADLNAARQFLKDNGITCEPEKNPTLPSLVDLLPDSMPDGDSPWQQ